MLSLIRFAFVFSALLGLAQAALHPIEVKGNAFFNSKSGDRFFIRGVDYQPGGSSNLTDPLADEDVCSRDVPYFKDLGINTIRVYSVDNSADHDACMKLLDDAGIYLLLDVNTPDASISRLDPGCSYNSDYLQNVFATIDAFESYDNVLGFFAGNEVINNVDTLFAAPYVKAVVRDMKKYIKARSYRSIPVGYSSADIASVRVELAHYFNCGNDTNARVDMFGINDYSWCGHSSFSVSGYSEKVSLYEGYSVPMFLSEYGCNEVSGARPFTEVGSIYSTQMSGVFSGGLVYEYSEEGSNYGLVTIDGDSVTTSTDFDNLKSELNSTSNPSGDGGYSKSNSISSCPTDWNFTIAVPDTPDGAETYFKNGAGTPLGFDVGDTQGSCDDDVTLITTTNVKTTSSKTKSVSKTTTTKESSSSSTATSTSTTTSSSSKAMAAAAEYGSLATLFTVLCSVLLL
ncbi:unnamed protein product [Kuraishia capsulata CBS 1993]|uniref:1,3-beta-glucanosyltransferase n=1 Tax=Kuraishia capsulata CBS 1993 TaxID=1382522 RepID=W6MIY6_9ASCO|nr:uncharacterized protein KUCA_T00002436001 [Kuraishia capsulata CBS 1993]CDK26464.1 unnamed protein product [Kuraishia capsulata CBS 1993]